MAESGATLRVRDHDLHGLAHSDEIEEPSVRTGKRVLRAAQSIAERYRVQADTEIVLKTCERSVADVIADEGARWPADLVVIGTHGRRGVKHLLLGSVAEDVVRASRIPVLTVRA